MEIVVYFCLILHTGEFFFIVFFFFIFFLFIIPLFINLFDNL